MTKLTTTKSVGKALLKSKATYTLLAVALTAAGYASGSEFAGKVEAIVSVLLGGVT